jgi:two-component system LytT family response regulator
MSIEHPPIRLRCLIVDDEPNAVNLLEMFIQQNTSWDLVAKCYDAREALVFLKTHTVDLIFLDINMPHLTGIEMAALLPPATRIVFTTAYSEFAAESYGFPTIDYLLKPITLKRFYAALQKIEDYFGRPDHQPGAAQTAAGANVPIVPTIPTPPHFTAQPQPNNSPEDEYFFVKSGRALQKILLKDILYFEGEKEYVRVVTPVHKLLVYRRLKDIEEQLSASFARVHNSYIVNIARMESIRDNQIFVGGKQIPISEKFREAFMNRIKERVF